jgi:hypothetical protein
MSCARQASMHLLLQLGDLLEVGLQALHGALCCSESDG